MKKFWKILGGIVSVAAVAFGAYFVYKNVIAKKDEDDFDDFDDCFDDEADGADREYVSINITEDGAEQSEENAEGKAEEGTSEE